MPRTFVIAFGNRDRADDGVAYHVIDAVRQHLGQGTLEDGNTGLDELGAQTDSVFLVQLVPELIDTLVNYQQVIFVDAHIRENVPDLHCAPVLPEYAMSPFTHHMTPAMLLALLQAIHHHEPVGHLVSIRGWEFDFRRGLSKKAAALVQPAADRILRLVARLEESSDPVPSPGSGTLG